jgi:hypothetical protein
VTQFDLATYRQTLETFLREYGDYLHELRTHPTSGWSSTLRTNLQRKTTLINRIVSSSVDTYRLTYVLNDKPYLFHAVLGFTLMENATEYEALLDSARSYIISIINEAIGNIENNTLPATEIQPALPIKDEILRKRCLDLLQGAGDLDRAINQATLVLETRLRDSIPYEKLSEVIPEDKDRVGEPLANKLLSPSKPVVVISDKPSERAAFHKVVVGMIAYFRNPSHHFLDDKTKSSLAWSVVGIIDSLLSQLEDRYVADDATDNKTQTKQK